MAAVQETVDRVRSIDVSEYKYGFVSDIESDKAPKGLSEDIVRFISAKKGEPEWLLQWRLDAYRRWLTMDEPKWARVEYPHDRLSGPLLFLGAQIDAGPKIARRGRSRTAAHLRQAWHSADRAGNSRRRRAAARRGRRGVRFRFGGDDLQGRTRQGRRDLLLVLRGGAQPPRTRDANISARWCLRPTISSRR